MLWLFFIVLLFALLIAVMPRWSYSQQWGYTPGGLIGLLLLIVIVLLVLFRLWPAPD